MQKTHISESLAKTLWNEGYTFWRRMTPGDPVPDFADARAKRYHDIWSKYLGAASGLKELVMAETRSVNPGLWNDRWELPYPFVHHDPAFQVQLTENISPIAAIQEILDNLNKAHDHVIDLRQRVFLYYHSGSLVRMQSAEEKKRKKDEAILTSA